MHEEGGERRGYSSPLRERQRMATRRLILEAVAGLVAEGAIHTFTVHDVAARAGISYASVYRHFPTREALLHGAYELAAEVVRDEVPENPRELAEVPGWIAASMRVFERYGVMVQALPAMTAALRLAPPSQRGRDELLEALVQKTSPGMPPDRARVVGSILRYLASAQAWATLRGRFELGEDDTIEAVTWALEVLIREVEGK
jgi:AcrR family transcriptional regulator